MRKHCSVDEFSGGTCAHLLSSQRLTTTMHSKSVGSDRGALQRRAVCSRTRLIVWKHNALQSDWDIVKRGWYAHVLGEAEHTFTDPVDAVTSLRVSGKIYGTRTSCSVVPSRRKTSTCRLCVDNLFLPLHCAASQSLLVSASTGPASGFNIFWPTYLRVDYRVLSPRQRHPSSDVRCCSRKPTHSATSLLAAACGSRLDRQPCLTRSPGAVRRATTRTPCRTSGWRLS